MENTFNKIQGKIKAAGLNIGLSDLEVVLYDIDPREFAQEFEEGVGPTKDDPIETLYTRAPRAMAWINFPGDRLGSILTNSQGHFELKYQDEEFRVRNEKEKRPDLCLFVLAPDRTQIHSPLGQDIAQRIVHYSWIPRAQSGRIESYVIAIPPERLKEFGISYRGEPQSGEERSKQTERNLRQDKSLKEDLRRITKAEVGLRMSEIEAFREITPKKFNWLSNFSKLDLSESGILFKKPNVESNVEGEAVVRGLTELGALSPSALVNLNPVELSKLEVDFSALSSGESVDINYCDLLSVKGFGQSFVKVRNLLEEQRRKKQAEQMLAPTNPVEESDGGLSTESETIDDPAAYLRQRVLGQVSEFKPVDEKTPHSTADDLAKIKDTINKLELSGGPANVTAYRDAHSLQVAFKHVWTAAFDKDLETQILNLYKETVKLNDDYGLSVADMTDINDINEFREFLSQVNDELSYGEVLPIHADVKACFPQVTTKIWNQLSDDGRGILETTAYNHKFPWSSGGDIEAPPHEWSTQEYLDERYAHVIKYHLTTPLARAEQLILDINSRLSEPYSFQYYAPFTVNYALLLSHRQELTPMSYQVGRLTSTTPLAPKQEMSFTVTEKINKSINQKSIDKSMSQRSSESQSTSRAEVEVMKKVNTSTNFRMTSQGSISLGVGSMSASSEFGFNQAQESAAKQNSYNESVKKIAEEVRQERELSVESAQSYEATSESVFKISNPNNELTVTYLLYELERRFSLRSHLNSMTPVIMVAMDIPAPHEITEAWLMEHAWILRRCLLDDGFYIALDYIETDFTSDSMDVEIKQANWQTQKRLVTELESNLEDMMRIREARRSELVRMTLNRDLDEAGESTANDVAKAIFSGGLSKLFGGGGPDTGEVLEAQRQAIESTLKYTEEKLEDVQGRLSRTQEKLQEATDQLTKAVKSRERKITAIRGIKLHVRQNIFHYMHNIWDYKHPDEILMTLQHQEVPFIDSATRPCRLRQATAEEIADEVPGVVRDGAFYVLDCGPPVVPDPTDIPKKALIEIAELERPLGYKGNYILFPLKKCSHLTDFMSQEFLDDYFGVRDPHTQSGYSTNELLGYATEVLNDPSAALSDDQKDALKALVFKQLTADTSQKEIILPTGQLYMEALKGEQSLLEDFKLAHRGMDVLKVQEEVREKRIENLRMAQRLSLTEPMLDSSKSDKTIVVRGGIDSIDFPVTED